MLMTGISTSRVSGSNSVGLMRMLRLSSSVGFGEGLHQLQRVRYYPLELLQPHHLKPLPEHHEDEEHAVRAQYPQSLIGLLAQVEYRNQQDHQSAGRDR